LKAQCARTLRAPMRICIADATAQNPASASQDRSSDGSNDPGRLFP
jgi:hypothetical protein